MANPLGQVNCGTYVFADVAQAALFDTIIIPFRIEIYLNWLIVTH
jgi:hypothetical protein